MKKLDFAVLVVFCSYSSIIFSQKQFIPEKKIYENSDGKAFIQKELPVYLSIGISPTDKNRNVVLKGKSPKFSNPLYLDAEGLNSIRTPTSIDNTTKKVRQPTLDVIYEVYADSKAPVTLLKYNKGKTFRKNSLIFLNSNVEIDLSAIDELSGVDKILYSVDSTDYKDYVSPFILNDEKEHILKYYSYDNVGNVEKLKVVKLFIDNTKPKSILTTQGDRFENTLSGNSFIAINTDKDSTGLAHIFVSMDNQSERRYNSQINTMLLTAGDHVLSYYSEDNVGNKETPQEFKFFVDKKPPAILQDIVGKTFMINGKEFSSGRSLLKLVAIDNKAGVKEIYYSINNGKYIIYNKPVLLSAVNGSLSVRTYAVDNVNNKSQAEDDAQNIKTSYVDLSGPTLSYHFQGPNFITTDTIYINKTTKIQLNGFDDESGMNNIQYKIDATELLPYSNAFSIVNDGLHTIEYIGTDNVENTNNSTFKILVDNSGPVIYPRFSSPPKGTRIDNGKTIDIYPGHVDLFIAATDMNAGYDHMSYILNDQIEKPFSGFIKGFGTNNKLTIKAVDKLGNETISIIEFDVQK